VASRERETNARARGCKSRRTTRINHAGRELFLATSSFNSAGRPAEGARPGPRATGIPAWNSSVIAPYDSRGNFFRPCLSLSPSRTRAQPPRDRFSRDQTRICNRHRTSVSSPSRPGLVSVWSRVPFKEGLYLAPMRPINPFIHFTTYLGNGNLDSAADWQRVGKNCQRAKDAFSFPFRPLLPPRRTDGRTDW